MGTNSGKSRRSVRYAAFTIVKAVLAMLIVALAITAGTWRAMQMLGADQSHAAGLANAHTVVVSAGDTLWSIAVKYGPQGKDPRSVVAGIRSINRMDNTDLRPGMVLQVPLEAL